MDILQKFKVLRKIDLLESFDDSSLRLLAKNNRAIALKSGEVLFHEDSLEKEMYIIVSGQMVVTKNVKQIAILDSGNYFGEMALIEAKPRSATARALQETVLLEIREKDFKEFLLPQREALTNMLRTLSSRVRNDLEHMVSDLVKMKMFAHDMKSIVVSLSHLNQCADDLAGIEDQVKSQPDALSTLVMTKDNIRAAAQGMKDLEVLINASLSHIKKIRIDYKKSPTCIASLIEDTREKLVAHRELTGKNIKVTVEENLPQAPINAIDIQRVLQNLTINAGHASKQGGDIEITAVQAGDQVQISVVDEGEGISDEVKPYLFLASVTTKEEGNGLGLLSCKNIVEDYHQGRLWFESELGKGTAFHFTLPLDSRIII